MQKQRSSDTQPELELRRALHRRGLRYRIHQPIVEGTRRKVDIVFRSARVAVDVRGCYWHGHPHAFAEYERKQNLDYWGPKIDGNRSRDADTARRLKAGGWELIVVWECEDVEKAARKIERRVRYGRQ